MCRKLIVKEVNNLEQAIGQIKKSCFVRQEGGIQRLVNNDVRVYTRDYVFLLKLVNKQPARWEVLK